MISPQTRRMLEPLLRRCMHFYWRFARGLTFGVRAVVIDNDDRVFLVRHTYVAGWHLPGGGVETGETALDALRRELKEEGNIALTAEPVLHGLFFNRHVSRRDHVAVYVVRKFVQHGQPKPNREIADCGFFDMAALPAGVTKGTQRRLTEVMQGEAVSADWLPDATGTFDGAA